MIQIDGLSFYQFNRALRSNKLPFISQLLEKKDHVLRHVNAGIPSSTPAFQAELFYGVPSFVPAFEFIDRQQKRQFRAAGGEMTAVLETPLGLIRIINTHFSLKAGDREKQIASLMEVYRTMEKAGSRPTVVCGDFNAGPGSVVYKTLSAAAFNDVQLSCTPPWQAAQTTFISWCPVRRIDHIFISPQLQPIRVAVLEDLKTRTVSDHLPVVADIGLSLTD